MEFQANATCISIAHQGGICPYGVLTPDLSRLARACSSQNKEQYHYHTKDTVVDFILHSLPLAPNALIALLRLGVDVNGIATAGRESVGTQQGWTNAPS